MNKSIFLIILIILVTFNTCRPGITDPFLLSGHQFNFNANGDSTFVISKGTSWWFADVVLDSTHYYLQHTDTTCRINYSNTNFQIKRLSCDTLFVKMSSNNSNSSRVLNIQIAAGDYWDYMNFTQSSK
jgi:hypothetical protein